MTKDEIIRMAREAGFEFKDRAEPKLERLVQAAYAAGAAAERKRSEQEMSMMSEHCAELILIEREACAKVCDDEYFAFVAADTIRARGETSSRGQA